MTLTAPPRPPRPSDPVDREQLEAIVEALIEEARRRARRRRRIYGAAAALVALVGVTVFAIFERSAQSQTASPALSAESSLSAATTSSKLAFIRHRHSACCGAVGPFELYVMNADGTGQQRLTRNPTSDLLSGADVWSPDGRKIAFERDHDGVNSDDIYVINTDGSGQRNLTRNPARVDDSLAWSPAQKYVVDSSTSSERPPGCASVLSPESSGSPGNSFRASAARTDARGAEAPVSLAPNAVPQENPLDGNGHGGFGGRAVLGLWSD